jgi:hypothetical protein
MTQISLLRQSARWAGSERPIPKIHPEIEFLKNHEPVGGLLILLQFLADYFREKAEFDILANSSANSKPYLHCRFLD